MDNEITRVGIKWQVDKLGRIVIPKEYREFYHLDHNDEVFIVDTKDGLLITNHKYKVIKVKNKKQNKNCTKRGLSPFCAIFVLQRRFCHLSSKKKNCI